MIMTSHGQGMFNADVVYTCTTCGLNCKSSSCPDYKKFTDKEGREGVALYRALPHGTQVNFIGRTIPPSAGAAGSGGAKFQVGSSLQFYFVIVCSILQSRLAVKKCDFYKHLFGWCLAASAP